MKLLRSIAASLLAFAAVAAPAFAQYGSGSVVGPSTYSFTAASQSNVWSCNSGQGSFQLQVPSGLTGTFTVTVGPTATTATNTPPTSFAPGNPAMVNTISNSGTLTVNLGGNLYVKVADTTYTSGSATVTGTCVNPSAPVPPTTSVALTNSTSFLPSLLPSNIWANCNCTSGTAVQIVPGVSGKAIYQIWLTYTSAATQTVSFVYATNSTCTTSVTTVWNGTVTAGVPLPFGFFQIPTGDYYCFIPTVTAQQSVIGTAYQQ